MTVVTSTPDSIGPAASRRPHFSDRPLRNIFLAAASLVMVAVVALFLTGSSGPAVVSFSLSSYAIPGHNIVVYGQVTNESHHAIGNAPVEVYRFIHGNVHILRQVRTTSDGLYRVVLNGRLDRLALHVRVRMQLHGTHFRGARKF